MKPTAKAKALQALRVVWSRLNSLDSLDELARHTLRATVGYAIEQIEQIQELKRPRRDKATVPVPAGARAVRDKDSTVSTA